MDKEFIIYLSQERLIPIQHRQLLQILIKILIILINHFKILICLINYFYNKQIIHNNNNNNNNSNINSNNNRIIFLIKIKMVIFFSHY